MSKPPKTYIEQAIYDILNGKHLTLDMTKSVIEQMTEGKATAAQIGAFLTAMRLKGETIDEITACALVMREKCERVNAKGDVLEIVGTGGDELNTFNISTMASIVIASCGIHVAKHGNRSVSSKCGSADLLEALGVNIDIPAAKSEAILKEIGICFMLAQRHHLAMKYVAPVRKELGVRTIFNMVGPLTNPAGANLQLMGVYDESLVEPMARVLANLGVRRAMVVHGHDGLDEISLTATTTVCEVQNGKLNSYFITPEQFGFERCDLNDIVGGDPKENAEIAMRILKGENTGAQADIVALNAAFCIYMASTDKTLRECVKIAKEKIQNGDALKKLQQLIKLSNEANL